MEVYLSRLLANHGADGAYRILAEVLKHNNKGLSAQGRAKAEAALTGFASFDDAEWSPPARSIVDRAIETDSILRGAR